MSLRCFFTKKTNKDGTPLYKARLVAKGFSQVPGLDFETTSAPLSNLDTIRVFLSIVCHKKLKLKQLDVNIAFLNGDPEEELYSKLPDGISGAENNLCKLSKSI